MYVIDNEITYFDSFCVEHVPKEIKKFIGHKNIKTNIFSIQADNSIMCGFIDFMFTGKSLIDFTSLFSPYDYKKNDHIILSYFKSLFKNRITYISSVFILNTQFVAILKYIFLLSNIEIFFYGVIFF